MPGLTLSHAVLEAARTAAETAATEAGRLLRAELLNPTGPRRSAKGAEVDNEMDDLIRTALLKACPDFGFASEESANIEGHDPHTRWIVDPHDGTDRFLRGERGSAISIALVHRGTPVVGVVYAPLAPHHGGDMLSWSQGSRLKRNGVVVERAPMPTMVDDTIIVALSPDADRCPATNAALVTPARFLATGCPAYRLALVAAGEADAAALLTEVNTWDVAGGDALLRAVGGVLLSDAGEPLDYSDPRGSVGRCYAGTAAVAKWLSTRSWPRHWPRESEITLAPAVRALVPDAGLVSRAQGCLVGLAAGDALGSAVEFLTQEQIAERFPDGRVRMANGGTHNTSHGQPTDDTELALALTDALLGSRTHDLVRTMAEYNAWLASRPFDVGNTIRAGLSGARLSDSESNGAMMRVAPLAVRMVSRPITEIIEAARLDAMLTHVSPVVRDSNAAYALGLVFAMRAAIPHRSGTIAEPSGRAILHAVRDVAKQYAFHPKVRQALVDASTMPDDVRLDGPDQGWCLLALRNAFYQLYHADSVEKAILDTARRGGDTDTTAAIAGALVGAQLGLRRIPLSWRRSVLTCRALPGTRQPRPSRFWPVHLLAQAEALIVSGLLEHADAPEPVTVKTGNLGAGLIGTVTWHPTIVDHMRELMGRPDDVRETADTPIERVADLFIADQLIVPATEVAIRAAHIINAFNDWLVTKGYRKPCRDARERSDRFAEAHQALYQRLHNHGGTFGYFADTRYWYGVRYADPKRMDELLALNETVQPDDVESTPYVMGARRDLPGLPTFVSCVGRAAESDDILES